RLEAKMEGVETALDRLATNVERLSEQAQKISVDLASVRENLRHLPTKHDVTVTMIKTGAWFAGIIIAVVGIIARWDQIAEFFANSAA
ncbi:MAG: hypothetical protein AAF449_00735, partial [Myxococcota bacterium]